jgi:hypothetical protein
MQRLKPAMSEHSELIANIWFRGIGHNSTCERGGWAMFAFAGKAPGKLNTKQSEKNEGGI